MNAVVTKYLPATDLRGARIKASTFEKQSIVISHRSDLTLAENHLRALTTFITVYDYPPIGWRSGDIEKGYIWVC